MENPFTFSKIAVGNAFCNRGDEQELLISHAKSSQNVILFSHRRMGKTSLLYRVMHRLKKTKPKITSIYIDLYGVLSETAFINKFFGGISQLESKTERLIKLFKGIKGTLSVDTETGNPSFSVAMQPSENRIYLEKAMQIIDEYSKKHKMIVIFDEFQEISGYENSGAFEKRLRSHIQCHQNICYVFSGSHKHLLTQMFNSPDRAFYQAARHLSLKPIDKKHYIGWAKSLFKKRSVDLDDEIIAGIVDRCEYQPMPIQQILHELWNLKSIGISDIDEIEMTAIESRKDTFITIWDSLSLGHRKTLKLVAHTGGEKVFSLDNLQLFGIKSTSAVQRSLNYLMDHQILTKNGGYRFQDVMFKKWIQLL